MQVVTNTSAHDYNRYTRYEHATQSMHQVGLSPLCSRNTLLCCAAKIFLLCSTHVPVMLNTCPCYAQHMSLLCSTHVPVMLNTCPCYAQHMSLLCSTHVPVMLKLCSLNVTLIAKTNHLDGFKTSSMHGWCVFSGFLVCSLLLDHSPTRFDGKRLVAC